MGYIDSLSSTVVSVVTRKGREVLARNDGTFRITKFKVGDDEINYQLYNPVNIDSEDADILAIPILEPSTDADSALRYPLVTLPEGTKRVAELVIQPNNILFDLKAKTDSVTIHANTLYNEDSFYIVSFTNINSAYVNSVSVSKKDLFSVTNNSTNVNTAEYIISTDHNLQLSKSSWVVVLSFTNDAAKTQLTSNVLLCTMIVYGQQSGVFTTMDIYGNIGASQKTLISGTSNADVNNFVNANTQIGGVKNINQTDPSNGNVIIGENF